MKRIPLYVQVLAAICLGMLVSIVNKSVGMDLKLLGQAFIRLIEMVIIPLIFPLIVLGVARMQSVRKLGRTAGKTILYFEVVTTAILVIAVFLANVTRLGVGVPLSGKTQQLHRTGYRF